TDNSCGEGALGTQPSWAFDVKLAREPGALFWNNGAEQIAGALDDDGVSFHFDSGILIDMRTEADHGKPPCSVRRHDRAEGKLGAATGDVTAFTGTLAYDFTPSDGSNCSDLAGVVVTALPCGFAYDLDGTRTDH